MHKQCKIRCCDKKAATPYGAYCSAHAANKRRHGDAEQKGVEKGELKPYIKKVQERRDKRPDAQVWLTMEARWNALVEQLKPRAEFTGATNKYGRIAAKEIVKLGVHVEARQVVDTVLALYLMYELDPRRFRSDEAFWFQLVRRTRGLTTLNYGSWISPTTGKPKSAAKELEPRATQVVARYIRDTLGVAGTLVAKIERQEEEQERKEALELYDQLMELA